MRTVNPNILATTPTLPIGLVEEFPLMPVGQENLYSTNRETSEENDNSDTKGRQAFFLLNFFFFNFKFTQGVHAGLEGFLCS